MAVEERGKERSMADSKTTSLDDINDFDTIYGRRTLE